MSPESSETKRNPWWVWFDALTEIVRAVLLIGLVVSIGNLDTWLRVAGGLALVSLIDITDELRQIRKAMQR